jgi:all-trans-retinol 13,14-reductase
MAVGVTYRQAKLDINWDAIVIGSGMGGLTAAVLLARHGGKRVLVLERHYEAGGFTHTFRRPGFDWDVGVHYIGDMQSKSALRNAFDHVTGAGVQWAAMPDVYDRYVVGDRSYSFAKGRERLRADLKSWFPAEAAAIDKYIKLVEACNRSSTLFYAEKSMPAPIAAVVGGLMRAPHLRWARRTTREVLESITGNRELIGVLTALWGDYGLPPAQSSFATHAMIAEHYFNGGNYPVGGSAVFAETMEKQIAQHGGLVVTSAEVVSIVLERGRAAGVRMADERELRSATVISAIGATNTLDRLLPRDLAATSSLSTQLRALPRSPAHLSLYLGLSKTDQELGLVGTNIWAFPTLDHDENVRRYQSDPSAPFPSVFLSFPSAKDPDFARRHPGKSTVEAVTPAVSFDAYACWGGTTWKKRGADYDAMKAELAGRLQAELEKQVPSVKGHIEHAELSTPLTTRHFMNYPHGEIYGIAATPARYALRQLGARTPIPGLYLSGQDTASLGVAGALIGGIICASVALGKNLFSPVMKG